MARPGEDDYSELRDAMRDVGRKLESFGQQQARESAAGPVRPPAAEPLVNDEAIRDAARQIRVASQRVEQAFQRGMEPQARAIQAGISRLDDAALTLRDAGRLTENIRSRLESLFTRAQRDLPPHLAAPREVAPPPPPRPPRPRPVPAPTPPREEPSDFQRIVTRKTEAEDRLNDLSKEYDEAVKVNRRLSDAQRRLLDKVNASEGAYGPLPTRTMQSARALERRGLVDIQGGSVYRTERGRGVGDPGLIQGDIAKQGQYITRLESELDDVIRATQARTQPVPTLTNAEVNRRLDADIERRRVEAEAERRQAELRSNAEYARRFAPAPAQGVPAIANAQIASEVARTKREVDEVAQRVAAQQEADPVARVRQGLRPRESAGGGGRDVIAYLDREMGILDRRTTLGARAKQLATDERAEVERILQARREAESIRLPQPITEPARLALPAAGQTTQMPLSEYAAGRRRFIAPPVPTEIERAREVAQQPPITMSRPFAPQGTPALANAHALAQRAAYEADIMADRSRREFNPALDNIRRLTNAVIAGYNQAIPEWERAGEVARQGQTAVQLSTTQQDRLQAFVQDYYKRFIDAGRLGEAGVRRGLPGLNIPEPPIPPTGGGGGIPPWGTPGDPGGPYGPFAASRYRTLDQRPFLPQQGVQHYAVAESSNLEDAARSVRGYENAMEQAQRISRESPEAMRAANAEVSRSVQQYGALSQAIRRHGAATTEFLTALGQGRTTVGELGWQVASTAGKFGAWTAASAGVFAALGAVTRLGQGAIQSASGVNELQRYVNNIDTGRAQGQFRDLSREFNLPISDVTEAAAGMARVFSNQDDALTGARAALMAVRVGDLSVADSTRFLSAIVQGFQLDAQQLPGVLDQINSAQNNLNFSVRDGAAGIARAAGSWKAAGGDFSTLLAIMTTAQRSTGASGEVVGTALRRSAEFVLRPANQQALRGFGIDPQQNVDDIYRQAFGLVQSGAVQGPQVTQLATALSSPQLAATIGPALQNYQLFNRALQQTGAEASRGSAGRELNIMLDSISERAKRIGTELEQMGSGLAQGGFLDVLGVGLETLTQLLEAGNNFLDIWNSLPGPMRQAMAMMLQVYGVMRIMRRLNVGESLSVSAGEMQPTSMRGRLRQFGMEQLGTAITGSPERAMFRKVEEAMDDQIKRLNDRLELSGRALAEHAEASQIARQQFEEHRTRPVNYNRMVAGVDERGEPVIRQATRLEAEHAHLAGIVADEQEVLAVEREQARMQEQHARLEAQHKEQVDLRTRATQAANRDAREGLRIAQEAGQFYTPMAGRPTGARPIPIELPEQTPAGSRGWRRWFTAAGAAAQFGSPRGDVSGVASGEREAIPGGVRGEIRAPSGLRQALGNMAANLSGAARSVDEDVIGAFRAGMQDVDANMTNAERASGVAAQDASGAAVRSTRTAAAMRGVGAMASRAARGLVGVGASFVAAFGPWGIALTALTFLPGLISHFQEESRKKLQRIRTLERPSTNAADYQRLLDQSARDLGVATPDYSYRAGLPGGPAPGTTPADRERAKRQAAALKKERDAYVARRFREIQGTDNMTLEEAAAQGASDWTSENAPVTPPNRQRRAEMARIVAEQDRQRAIALSQISPTTPRGPDGQRAVPMQFVEQIDRGLNTDLNALKSSNNQLGDARALYAKYLYEYQQSMENATGPKGRAEVAARIRALKQRMATLLSPGQQQDVFRDMTTDQLAAVMQQQTLEIQAFGSSDSRMQSAVLAYMAMVEQVGNSTDPAVLQRLVQAQQSLQDALNTIVADTTRSIQHSTTPAQATSAFEGGLSKLRQQQRTARGAYRQSQEETRKAQDDVVRARMTAGAAHTAADQSGAGFFGAPGPLGAPIPGGSDAARKRAAQADADLKKAEAALKTARANERANGQAFNKAKKDVEDARADLGKAYLESASLIDSETNLKNAQANNDAVRAANTYQGAKNKEAMARRAYNAGAIDKRTYDDARAETLNQHRASVNARIDLERKREEVRIARLPEEQQQGATIAMYQRLLNFARKHGADEETILDLQQSIAGIHKQDASDLLARQQALEALQEQRLPPDQRGARHARDLLRDIATARKTGADDQVIWGLQKEYYATLEQNEQQRQQDMRDTIAASAELQSSMTDDPVALARIAENEARRTARVPHPNTVAGRNQAKRDQAAVNTRHRERIQAQLNTQLSDADYLRDIGTYSQQELLDAYEKIYRQSAGAGPEFRKQLRQRIGRLKHEIEGSSSDFVLDVGNIKLPTVYDVRKAFDPIRQRVRDAHKAAADMETPSRASAYGGASTDNMASPAVGDVQTQINVYVNDPNAATEVFTQIDRAMKTHVRAKARSAGRRKQRKH